MSSVIGIFYTCTNYSHLSGRNANNQATIFALCVGSLLTLERKQVHEFFLIIFAFPVLYKHHFAQIPSYLQRILEILLLDRFTILCDPL